MLSVAGCQVIVKVDESFPAIFNSVTGEGGVRSRELFGVPLGVATTGVAVLVGWSSAGAATSAGVDTLVGNIATSSAVAAHATTVTRRGVAMRCMTKF
ncbi:hypothetical protein GCM10009638_21250 [Luteococcus sanguinis]